MNRQRVDKWLWHARVAKTRSLAQALVEAGHVRLNKVKIAKSSHEVAPGDVLTIAVGSRVLVYRVQGFADRRGGAPEARRLYEDLADTASAQKGDASANGSC